MSDEAVLAAWKLNIPPVEKIILQAIAHLCEKKLNHCSATIKKLSELSGVSPKTVSRKLNWLEENKLIRRSRLEDRSDRTNRLEISFGHFDPMVSSSGSNLPNLARACLETKKQTPPLAFQASYRDPDGSLPCPEINVGSSNRQQKKAPRAMSDEKMAQADFFPGQRLGKHKKGHFWEATDRVEPEWMRAAAEFIETQTRYQRINLKAAAEEFAAYWSERRDSKARKSDWRRTYINRCIELAKRAGYRERSDAHLSHDGFYENDDDYGIGYRR